MPALGPKLTQLTSSLISALLHALSDSTLRKTSVVTLTSQLIWLGQANAARDAFLGARSELVRKRARGIGFEGEIAHYITELAIVIFTSIKHTAEWYLASFKENDMASGMCLYPSLRLYAVSDECYRSAQVSFSGPLSNWSCSQASSSVNSMDRRIRKIWKTLSMLCGRKADEYVWTYFVNVLSVI